MNRMLTQGIKETLSSLARSAVKQGKEDYYRAVLGLVEDEPGAKVLDCGCGDGTFTLTIGERVKSKNLFGVEAMADCVEASINNGIECRQADLNDGIPFGEGVFDVVIACQLIEHLCRTDTFLKEIFRVLKRGGYAVISTPNLASLYSILSLLVGRQPAVAAVSDELMWVGDLLRSPVKISGNYPLHRRIFTLRALTEVLKHHGFAVEETKGTSFHPLPTLLARVACFIDKKHAGVLTVKARKR